MKRFLSLFLFAILFGSYAMAYDFSAICESGQTLYYNITSSTEPYTVEVTIQNTLGISPYYSTYPIGNLEIPESVEYDNITYSVTNIGYSAFSGCSGLTSVTITNSVTSIGDYAFQSCSGLTSVTIGNSVTDIGNHAFAHCIGLTEITIPNSVTSIGISAFEQCTGLTTVNYNAINCTTMGNNSAYAFIDCNATATINIGSNVTTIPDYAFEGLLGNGILEIPNSVTNIGYSAFSGCSGLTSVTIPNSVTSIGNSAFSSCSGLTSVTIGNSVTSIGNYAFSSCSGLTSVTIGNSVTSIGDGAFSGCSELTTINFNATNCTSMGSSDYPVFKGCNANATINIGEDVTTIPNYAFKGLIGSGVLSIPNSVTSIGNYAFYSCIGLTSVKIGNSVTSIGDYVFSNCSGLTTVNYNATNCTVMGNFSVFSSCSSLATLIIGESVTNIPANAFSGCSVLTSVTIPNSVTNIGGHAFYNCSGLTSVTIGNSVMSIGSYAFWNCNGLTTVNYNATNCASFENYNGISGNTNITNLNIGENVTNIPAYAFSGCSGLTEVTIPSSITSIGSSAFSGCSGITTINFNATNCTSMGNSAYPVFNGCNANAAINIGEGVTTIPDYAFKGLIGSGALSIPSSVTDIGQFAFDNCSGLTSVTIPNSVTNISNYTFSNCSGLTTITIGNSVTGIGFEAFSNCIGLTAVYYTGNIAQWCGISFNSQPLQYAHNLYVDNNLVTDLVIPNDVSEIKPNVFYGATCLASVTIPSSVTSIGDNAFYDCSGLTAVYYAGNIAQWCGITFGSLSSNPLSYAHNLYINNELLTNLVIPETVTELKNYAFSGCSCLAGELSIPNSVVSIGESAFQNCIGLTSLTIPSAVTNIGNHAFGGCFGLSLINYNAIDCWYMENVFYSSAYITSTMLADAPSYSENFDSYDGAQDWGAENGSDCVAPTGWYVYTNSTSYAAPHITTNGNPHSSPNALSFCNNQSGNTSYAVLPPTLNNGVITFYARNESSNVGTLSLGYVTTSQSNVSSFVEILEIGRTEAMTLRQYEFSIPSGAYLAFRWNQNDRSIWYAAAIDDINVYYYEELTNSLTLNIGENVASIPNSAFDGLGGLTTVNFNATNCTTMGSSDYPVFNGCTSLATLNIGANVTIIPNNAFKNCSSIDSLTCAAENPPQVFANTFEYDNLSNIPVIVPCGTIPVYENADFWYNFRRIQQSASCPVPYTITVLSSNPNYGTVTGGGVYMENTTATLTATPYEECMFVNWNDGNTDNPREITVTEDATYIATFVRGTYNPTIYNAITDTACGSYTWNGDIYTESGEYEQTFTAANSVDSVVTLTLTILQLPVPEITVDGILDACNPETTSVTLHTGEYDSYIWSNAATGESTIVTTPGEYSVEVVDSMGCHGFSEGVTVGYSTILTEAPYITNVGMKNNGYNMLQWDMDAADTVGVRGFYIYREDAAANAFSFIKHINKPRARSFTDSTADPTARAYRYKICAVDECGGMSPVSTPHRTMHLTINQGIGNTWNLIWSPYEGLPIRSYKIYRGTTMQNMVVIGEVPGNQTSYTDNGNPYNAGFFYKVVTIKNTRSDNEEDEDIMLSSNVVDNGYIVMRTVIVAPSNPANGTASGSGSYPDGTIVTLWATANAGYEFSAWNDGSAENPRSVTITSDTLFIANFVEIPQTPTHTITVYSSNQAYGTVSGGGTYEEGSEIQLIATANNGYEFVSWSDGSIENPHAITVTEDAMYIATFIEAQPIRNFTVTVISANPTQGTVIGGGSYPEGTEITIEAIANEGYEFISWSDNNTENPRQITVTADAMYIATFMSENGVDEFEATETEIFPNPATDILNITSSETISEIEIVNVMGQVVKRMEVNSNNAVCDVEDLKAGVYIVRIHGTVVSQRKFIKE